MLSSREAGRNAENLSNMACTPAAPCSEISRAVWSIRPDLKKFSNRVGDTLPDKNHASASEARLPTRPSSPARKLRRI